MFKKKSDKGKRVNDFVRSNEMKNRSKLKNGSKERVMCFEFSGYDHLVRLVYVLCLACLIN